MPLAEAGVLLCVYSLKQLLFCVSRKRPLQRIRGIELESLSHTRPCETIVAKDPLLGQAFDLAGTGLLQIDLHFNRRVDAKRMESRAKQKSEYDDAPSRGNTTLCALGVHGLAPMWISFPITTPEATDIVAAPEPSS